jgi:hypothetical protein
MKAYFVIFCLFCTIGLSYGSSHIPVADSVVKNQIDTIKIGKTDRNRYYYKGYKPLTQSELEFLLKNAHDEQVDRYLTESKIESNNSKTVLGVVVFTVVLLGVLTAVSIVSLFSSIFTGRSANIGGGIIVAIFGIFGLITLPFLSSSAKKKSDDLKRKAVERYNDIVKSGK